MPSDQQAHELPVKNLCPDTPSVSVERDGGIYDCSDGSWVAKDSECCTLPIMRYYYVPQRAEFTPPTTTRPFDVLHN